METINRVIYSSGVNFSISFVRFIDIISRISEDRRTERASEDDNERLCLEHLSFNYMLNLASGANSRFFFS